MSNIYEDIQWVHNVLKYEISYPLLIRAVSRTLVIYETGLLANKLNKPFSDQLLENPISSQLFEDRFSFGTQFFYAMFLITFLPIFMLECFQIAWSDIFLSSFCLLFHLSIYIYFFSFFTCQILWHNYKLTASSLPFSVYKADVSFLYSLRFKLNASLHFPFCHYVL